MEKISRIIPSNARTKAVDVSRSQPVRPGAPAWGRPVGKVTTAAIEDKISLSSIANERELPQPPMTYRNSADAAKVRIAENVTNKFFENRVKDIQEENGLSSSEEIANAVVENSEMSDLSS